MNAENITSKTRDQILSTQCRILNVVIESCLIFLVVFTPLALGTVQLWSIFIMRIAVTIAFTAWLLKIFNAEPRTPNLERRTPLLIPILIFLSVAVISTITSVYKWISLSLLGNLFAYAAVYFLIVNNLKSKTQVKRLITAIFLTSLVLGIYGLLQYHHIVELTPRVTEERICSSYYNSNHYAGYLAMITPIPIALFLFLPWSRLSIPMILLSILLVINLALSYSWGSIGFGVGIIFLVITRIYLSKRRKFAATIAAVILISFTILGAAFMLSRTPKLPEKIFTDRYAHMVNFASQSMSGRLYMYKKTIPLILSHPHLGTGPGTFIYLFPKYRPLGLNLFWNYAHNDYLQISSEMGLIGLAAFLFLVTTAWTKSFRVLKSTSSFNRALTMGILAGILSILVHGLFDANLSVIPANILHFYVILGLLMVLTTSTNVLLNVA